jgi:hypothetical protein
VRVCRTEKDIKLRSELQQYLRLVVDGQDDLIDSDGFQCFNLHQELKQAMRTQLRNRGRDGALHNRTRISGRQGISTMDLENRVTGE